MNMYSFVKNPFTESAEVDWDKLAEMTRLSVRLLDDIVDLELEKVQKIIDKVESDPEDESIKRTELELWQKIYKAGEDGRRLGLGTTADGDMVAALGLTYGTQEANDMLDKVHKFIGANTYYESIKLAFERGAFKVFNWEAEKDDYFVNKMLDAYKDFYGDDAYNQLYDMWKNHGRRNIACLTLAPVGSGSTQTQTASGFEPVFSLFYQRKRKIDDKKKADFIDEMGDAFEINNVVHHKFVDWYISTNATDLSWQEAREVLAKMPKEELEELIKKSPYYGATANEIDPVMKVKLQGAVQNWIDNSISCTVNLPEDTTVETVNAIYLEAYKAGCKGCTIYRDNCRSGVLTTGTSSTTKKETTVQEGLPTRPDVLDAEVVRFRNGDEQWIAYIGLKDGKPYEIFTGLEDKEEHVIPKSVTKGKLIRVNDKKKKRYDFSYEDKYGYTNTIGGISHMFNKIYWNYAKFISGYLRNNVPIVDTISVLEGLNFDKDSINTWKNGVIRALKKYVKDGTVSKSTCPECGAKLTFENGCKICKECGYSAC